MPEIASYWQANYSRRPLGGVKRVQRAGCRSCVVFLGFWLVNSSRLCYFQGAMKLRALLILAAANLCASSTFAQLTAADVTGIINRAVTRAVKISKNSVIAVTDREGDVLAVWVVRGGNATDPEVATAVSKAGTAAYLSSNQDAFTSRTAGFIIQQHFPPGVSNTAPGPLVGVGLSNLFISDINKFRAPGSMIVFNEHPGLSIVRVCGSSLDGSPGGVPLYKNGQLV